ncbi:MAG: ParB/Srx family N-terminal domain-containing protein [Desulfosarcinaceae bacterium]|nr:ParB/Srx family N-terminal domain-containing protein [Desulfosarcinaceae bacterium]
METTRLPLPSIKRLSPDTIDMDDVTFQVSANGQTEDLEESITLVGLINPPWVVASAHGWRIVSGFRRIGACAALGLEKILARCLPADTSLTSCTLLAIADNALQRQLTLLEQIRASRLLLNHVAADADLRRTALAVGLPPNVALLRQLAALAAAPPELMAAIAHERVALPMATALTNRPLPETVALAALFNELRPSLNRQRELLSLLDDIARRDDVPPTQVLTEALKNDAAADNTGIDRSLRLTQLRMALRTRRYPHLVRAEQDRHAMMKALPLGPDVQLQPPTNFEGRRFQLHLAFGNLAELEAHAERLQRLLAHPTMTELLD